MNRLCLATALFAALPLGAAHAARHEASFEAGIQGAPQGDAWEVASSSAYVSLGARLGYAILKRDTGLGLSVSLRYTHQGGGAQGQPYLYGAEPWRERLDAHDIAAGARVDWGIKGFFFPYARVEGVAQVLQYRLDTGRETTEGSSIDSTLGMAGGASFMGGVEFIIPIRTSPVTVGFTMEGGYDLLSNGKLGSLGSVNLSGAAFRGGVGLRW